MAIDNKNNTLMSIGNHSSISGNTMGATTIGTFTIGGQTGFTGSVANSTVINFKKKL